MGKIYSAEVSRLDLPQIKERYPITSQIAVGNRVNIRFISDERPFDKAVPCDVSVEDALKQAMRFDKEYMLVGDYKTGLLHDQ